jgi:hypothetical protein
MAANDNVFLLPDGVFGPPEYNPVSFENLEQDTFYLVRMTAPVTHAFVDLVLLTTHALTWKTADRVRPKLLATRKFKRMFDIQTMLDQGLIIPDGEEGVMDEEGNFPPHVSDVNQHDGEATTLDDFTEIVDHPRAEEVFFKLPYATDENGALVPDEWFEHDVLMTYPILKDEVKMEVDPAEVGYVFYKGVNEPQQEQEQEGGRRRRQRSRRRSNRRATRRPRRHRRRANTKRRQRL